MSPSPKVVVVTGASQGIGAEVVNAFRELDYRIIATARSIRRSEDPNILTVAGDIGDPSAARRVIAESVERFGWIDTLVNNAGIYIGKPFTEHTAEDHAAVMNVNVSGFYYITQLAIAQMQKQLSGHVVTVTASIVHHAMGGLYTLLAALTKGGLNAATRSLAIGYARRGIRVNAVSPGIINTLMHAAQARSIRCDAWARQAILPTEFCISIRPFVTGEILHVDGGQSAGH